MHFIGRLLVIVAGFLAASLVATIVLFSGLQLLVPGMTPGRLLSEVTIWQLAAVMLRFLFPGVVVVTTVPSLLVIVVAEVRHLRSLAYYLWSGAAIGAFCQAALILFGSVIWPRLIGISAARPGMNWAASASSIAVAIVAGVSAAVVYWLIAGRNAGRWRVKPATVTGQGG